MGKQADPRYPPGVSPLSLLLLLCSVALGQEPDDPTGLPEIPNTWFGVGLATGSWLIGIGTLFGINKVRQGVIGTTEVKSLPTPDGWEELRKQVAATEKELVETRKQVAATERELFETRRLVTELHRTLVEDHDPSTGVRKWDQRASLDRIGKTQEALTEHVADLAAATRRLAEAAERALR